MTILPIGWLNQNIVISLPTLPHLSEKVQKRALAALAILSAILGGALIAKAQAITTASGALLICAIGLTYRVFHANPKYRIPYLAGNAYFSKMIKQHGLGNVLKFALIPKKDLLDKLEDHLKEETPVQIARLHLEVLEFERTELEGETTSLTHLFKNAMLRKLRPYQPSEIFEFEDIEILIRSTLFSRELINAHERWLDLRLSRYRKQDIELRKAFNARVHPLLTQLHEIARTAQSSDPEGQKWLERLIKDLEHLDKVKCFLNILGISTYTPLQNWENRWEDLEPVQKAQRKLAQNYQSAKKEHDKQSEKIEREYRKAIDELNSKFNP